MSDPVYYTRPEEWLGPIRPSAPLAEARRNVVEAYDALMWAGGHDGGSEQFHSAVDRLIAVARASMEAEVGPRPAPDGSPSEPYTVAMALEDAAKIAEREHSLGTSGLGIAEAIRHFARHPALSAPAGDGKMCTDPTTFRQAAFVAKAAADSESLTATSPEYERGWVASALFIARELELRSTPEGASHE